MPLLPRRSGLWGGRCEGTGHQCERDGRRTLIAATLAHEKSPHSSECGLFFAALVGSWLPALAILQENHGAMQG